MYTLPKLETWNLGMQLSTGSIHWLANANVNRTVTPAQHALRRYHSQLETLSDETMMKPSWFAVKFH